MSSNGRGSLTAFTSVFDAGGENVARDERDWARIASAPYANINLEEVPAARGEWRPVFERAAWHLDAPNFSPAIVPLWAIMERAHERGVKVMLEGQGGDELLGGYVQHAALAWMASIQGRNGPRRGAPHDFVEYGRTFTPLNLALWVTREAFPPVRHSYGHRLGTSSVLRPSFRARFADLEIPPAPSRRLGDRLVTDHARDILPALLHYGDAISSAHSIEARQPFLDYRLVELCVGLPDRWKVAGGETKRVLRGYLRSIGQRQIAARTDKLGFPTPIWEWLVADNAAAARDLLLDHGSRTRAFCSPPAVERLIERTQRSSKTGSRTPLPARVDGAVDARLARLSASARLLSIS